ncbi:hypothetical protein LCGC14_2843400, partial [marine sediment metagenome]
ASGSGAFVKKTLAETGAILEADLDHGNIQGLGDDDHTQYILKTLFDAQSVLAATSDNTPAVLTLAEQTLVGRLTGGNVAAIAMGIADNNILQVDGSPNSAEYARFTAAGIEGRSFAEVKADLDLEIGTDVLAQQTIGIADNNLVEIDSASAASGEYAKLTANGLESKTFAELLADLSGQAGAAFDWGGQNLTNINSIASFNDITMQHDGANAQLFAEGYIASPTHGGQFVMRGARGSLGTPTAVQNGDRAGGAFFFAPHNGVDFASNLSAFIAYAIETHDASNRGTKLTFATTAAGATSRTENISFNGDGSLDLLTSYLQLIEMTAPGAGAANTVRTYAEVDGGSLTDYKAVFQDGTVVILAEEVTPLDSPLFTEPSKTVVTMEMRKSHPGLQQFGVVF